jgi:DNA-binding transcriptional ArsR family regulator
MQMNHRPLYDVKAGLFKTLGHPVRIRVLELLSLREHAVGQLLPEVGVEATSLSHQLAALRHAGLVTFRKEGSTVYYSLASPRIAELLTVAKRLLAEVMAGQVELLAELRPTVVPPAVPPP